MTIMMLGSARYRTNAYDDSGQVRRRERQRRSATAINANGMEAEISIQQGSLPPPMNSVLRVSEANTSNATEPSDDIFPELAPTYSYGTEYYQTRAVLNVSSQYRGCASELTTTFDDNLGSFGNMFDIHTYNAIEIYGIDIYTDVLTPVTFEIYTKANTFKDDGGKEDINVWTMLIRGSTNGAGKHMPTPIRGFNVLNVPANTTMAFYVTLTTPDLRYRDIRPEKPDAVVGEVYTKNDDLEIRVGVSVADYPFAQAFFGKRSWSGTLHYVNDSICASNMPSSSPTVRGSLLPSSTPSLEGSSNPSAFPSSSPSLTGSSKPSRKGSSNPSAFPSSSPSLSRSSKPSRKGSSNPSAFPSSSPSFSRSSKPSMVPSTLPSLTPTLWETLLTDLPTTVPTLLDANSSQCAEKGSIGLAMDGGTGAYGCMFTVTSHNSSLIITSLSFHTDFTESECTAQVFTKKGNFTGFENMPNAWRQISESILTGKGAGFRTKIPREDFEAVKMQPHETRSFYITLPTADIRYSKTELALGEPVAANEFISVNAGAGLADYPFASKAFIYEPRQFNGAVHFEAITECRPTGSILYYFNVQHMRNISEAELTQRVSENVKMTVANLIETELELIDLTKISHLLLQGTDTTVEQRDSCTPISPTFNCTSVGINVTLQYDALTGLRWRDLQFTFLKFYEEVALKLNFEFESQYVGDLPLEEQTNFTLKSDTNFNEMTADQAIAFEDAIIGFLEAPLKAHGITHLGVKVVGQDLSGDEWDGERYSDRQRQLNNIRSINIATAITGEYRPLPEVDFDGVVSEAIDADTPELEKRIRRSDPYFEIVNSVTAETASKPGSEFAQVGKRETKNQINVAIIAAMAAIGGILTFMLLILCFVQRKKQREKDKWNQHLNLDSDVLDTGHGVFFGLFGKRNQNAFKDFGGNAMVTSLIDLPASSGHAPVYQDLFADEFLSNKKGRA